MRVRSLFPLTLTLSQRERERITALLTSIIFLTTFLLSFAPPARAAVLDSYMEDFDSRATGSIDGVELFTATSAANALVQTSVTSDGTGKSLQLTGTSSPPTVTRSTSYGGLSPTWVKFLIRPGIGGERRTAPTSGVAAVSFDFSGKILAADGKSWVDTGATYTGGKWYEVAYKLNFTSRTYDVYVRSAGAPQVSYVPVKTGLNFIDSSKTSLSTIQIQGAYSSVQTDETYFDDLAVKYIERIEFTSASQTIVQGQISNPITIQLQSASKEPQKATEDTVIELKASSISGRFSLQKEPWLDVTQVTIPKDSSTATFYYQDAVVGKPILSVKEYPDQGWLEGLQEQKIVESGGHFDIQVTSPQTAGQEFPLKIVAYSEGGGVDTTYAGTVELKVIYESPDTGTRTLNVDELSGFSDGVLEKNLIYPDAGTIRIEVTDQDESEKKGESGSILFQPARFSVSAGGSQVVDKPFDLTVTALSATGEITPNYQGTVNFSTVESTATGDVAQLSPASTNAFSEGAAGVSVSYSRWGTVSFTATDSAGAGITGQSDLVSFKPDKLQLAVVPPPSPRDFYYTSENFVLELKALSAAGSPIPNYMGTVSLFSPSSFSLPQQYSFVLSDAGFHKFVTSGSAAGSFKVEMEDAASELKTDAADIKVKEAILQVVSTSATVGTTAEVEIVLLDEDGQVITSESAAKLTVQLQEDIPNGSISSSALTQEVQITNGRAFVTLTNSEEESVTLLPTSALGLKATAGTITFGRFAKKGVGIVLWREVIEEEEVPEEETRG